MRNDEVSLKKEEKKMILSLRSVTALGVVVAQIVAWAFPIPEYEEHNETGVSDTKVKKY